MNRQQLGGLLFLAFSLSYGLAATRIASLPIDRLEAMNARSLPYALAVLGSVLSIVLIVSSRGAGSGGEPSLPDGDWRTVGLLIGAIAAYGLVLDTLGFPLSTAIFLCVSCLLLGERRWRRILGVSVALVGVLWLILVPGLGVYLAPGSLWQ